MRNKLQSLLSINPNLTEKQIQYILDIFKGLYDDRNVMSCAMTTIINLTVGTPGDNYPSYAIIYSQLRLVVDLELWND